MRRLIVTALIVFGLAVNASAQDPPIDCSSGCNGPTGEQWSPSQSACVAGANMSCQTGCSCIYGFFLQTTLDNGRATSRLLVFGGGNTPDGFRLDLIGPFGRNRIKAGDRVYRLNGRRPTRALVTRYTDKRPARRAQATYDDAGRLWLKLQR